MIVGEIARGGMGVVFRANDPELSRDVAIKLMRESHRTPDAVQRFLGEASITARLQHPGIPPVHEVGRLADGSPFLAMKLIEGRTLDALLRARPDTATDRGRFVAIFEHICQAVGYAHSRGVIHRDLKPANIMVGAFGEVQVMDWGLAKQLRDVGSESQDDDSGMPTPDLRLSPDGPTQIGAVLGTPQYMPPEQAAGRGDAADRRSDVFGLGGILCTILTGSPPFTAESAESTWRMAAGSDLTAAMTRLAGCGAEAELISLCRKCLSPGRADRPADAGEVARAVASFRAEAEDRAYRAEIERAKAVERRKRWAALVACGLTLVSGAGIAAWVWQKREAERRVVAEGSRRAAESALDQAETALRRDNPSFGEIDAPLDQARRRIEEASLDDLRPRFDALSADRRILESLDDIDTHLWTVGKNTKELGEAYALARFPLIFERYGVGPDSANPVAFTAAVRHSPIGSRLTAALFSWLGIGGPPWLAGLVADLDPEPTHGRLIRAFAAKDHDSVSALVTVLDGRALPPAFAQYVGGHPLTPKSDAMRILTAAQARYPEHFGLALETALYFGRREPEQYDRRIGYYRIAMAIRPGNPICRHNLGFTLVDKGELDDAVEAFRGAIRVAPKFAKPYHGLGYALWEKGDLDGAAAAFRESIRIDPTFDYPWINLGFVLRDKKDYAGAIGAFREAVRITDDKPAALHGLGLSLAETGDRAGALAAFREASRLDPKMSRPHNGAGFVLKEMGDLAGAAAEFREAIRLDPRFSFPRYNLGTTLREQGDRDGAIAAFADAVKLKVADPRFYTELAELHAERGEYAAALRVLREGLAAKPSWVADLASEYRFRLARYACLVASGNAKDSPTASARPGLRREALTWLTEDLKARRNSVSEPRMRAALHDTMRQWLTNPDFVSVRNVRELPEDERGGWEKLWDEVRAVRDATSPTGAGKPH